MPRKRPAAGRGEAAARWGIASGLSAWWAMTLVSQHPHRTFDVLRGYDPFGLLLPNWRFFAPNPAQHDFHVLHRVLGADGERSEWTETSTIDERRIGHMVWFPNRRENKAVSDIAGEILTTLSTLGVAVERTVGFIMLRDYVEAKVRAAAGAGAAPQGFQFLIIRYSGYDDEHEPEYLLASPYIALTAHGAEATGPVLPVTEAP